MIRMQRKYFLHCLVVLMLLDITYSHDNDTSTGGQRHGRVSGRIVKLYSGPKPDPVLCTSEGFLEDVVDCSVFYRCIKTYNGKYTVYRFQCGPGTVYDPDTEICNHPRSTKRLHCGGLSSDKVISSTETFIENEIDGLNKENHELPSPISTKPPKSANETPKPVKFESSQITASYPWISASNHINHEITTTSTASPWNVPPAISSKKPWEYTQTTYIVTRQPNIQSSAQCTSDGFMGDGEDCRKFYRCVNNQRGGYLRYEFSCSESTIWDDDTQGCNHPWAVQRRRCGKGSSYDENSIGVGFTEHIKNNEVTPNNIVQHQTQISYGSKVTQIQTQISTGPATQNQTQINFGDRLYTGESSPQLGYGAPASQSQAQFNYGNEITPAHSQVHHSNHFSETQTPVTDIISSSTTISNSNVSNKRIQSKRCTTEGFMGDSDDCQKFYRCIGDEKRGFAVYEFSCTEGTLWDEKLEACNHAWAVKECGGKKSNQNMSSETANNESTTVKHYTTTTSPLYGNEIDEHGYLSQNNQQESNPSSTATQAPVLTTVATDSSRPYKATDCKANGFFGNVNDCSKFYRCVENSGGKFTKYEYKCGDGTVWDPEIESCNHAWSVKSCGTSGINITEKEDFAVSSDEDNAIITTVSLIQTTTQKNIIDHDYDSGYQIAHSDTPLQATTTTTTESIASHGDVCKTSGFMGGSDCKKFYRCVENGRGGYTRHEFTCGEGTVWDPDIEACNHAWAVKTCGGSSMPDNSITSLPSVSQDNLEEDNGYNNNQEQNKDPGSTIKTSTPSATTNFIMPVTNRGNDCQSNGFMGSDNDCKIFYRCVENGNGSFVRYEFSCGDGTVWDPKISACNHVWAVEKCGGSNSVHESSSHSIEQPNYTTTSGSETSTPYTTTSSSSTILSSTISDSNDQCIADGFIGDKNDCKKFYRCVEDGTGSYIRYEFACGEGTVWDSKIQACNHAWAVESCGNNTSSHSGSTLTSRPTTVKDEEITSNSNSQNIQGISGSTENIIWSSSTIQASTNIDDNEKCKTEGFMGDSDDCKKFYRCVNDGKGSFIRYQFSCGDGTVWDSEINACNHVDSVKTPCNFMSTRNPEEKEPNYTVNSSPTEVSDYPTTSKMPTISQHCEQEGFIGDKTDCKKFYRCTDNGQGGFHRYEFTCGEGTVWDQESLACIHGSPNFNCGSMNKEPQTDNSNFHPTTISTDTVQSTEKTQTSSNNDVCTSEGFYANSNDCKKFFRCVGDSKGGFTKYDFTCGEGTIWVQDIQACDHHTDTSLCSTGTINTSTTSSPSHSSQEKPTTSVSTSTTKSTIIDQSTSAPSTKPILEDETVAGSSTSETSSTASTSSSGTNQDRCEEAGFFGNSQDCKMFYRCVDDGKGGFTKYDFTCGDGTIWDQDITACNHPQDVSNPSCKNEENAGATTKTTTTTTSASNVTPEPTKGTSTTESTTTQNINQSTPDSSTNKPNSSSSSSNNYTCTEAGFYADPYDCKKFYRCVDWGGDGKTFSIYHFDCGEGTIWDPNLNTCNHEESVYPPRDCSGSQSQTEISNNTTTTAKQEETTESSTTEPSTTTTQSTTTTTVSSTTDQTSTQQSSTSEPTSATQQSTTQTSTTEQSTTQKSTTEQSTSEPTTQQSTTEQSTSQQSTTEKSTTQQSTTASEQSTTEKSTTQQSTTASEQSTTEKSTTEQSTTASEQSTTQQSSTTTQSTTSEQSSTTSEQTTTTTTEQTTTTSNEDTTTTSTTTTSESTTSATDQTTKASSTTQESTEQSSESQSTTEQSTTQETTDGSSTTESGQDTTTEQESSNNECPQTDDDQYVFVCPTGFKRHPKYCNLFYQCTEDDDSHEMKVAVFHCPNNTIYDESKTQCVEEEKADKKCDGQIAQRRRVKRLDSNYKEPITVDKGKNLCPGIGHFPFDKNEQCSPVLFKCDTTKAGKLRGFIYQCPNGYAYWSVSRRCEPVSIMAECKRSLSTWSARYEIPIERNNVGRKKFK